MAVSGVTFMTQRSRISSLRFVNLWLGLALTTSAAMADSPEVLGSAAVEGAQPAEYLLSDEDRSLISELVTNDILAERTGRDYQLALNWSPRTTTAPQLLAFGSALSSRNPNWKPSTGLRLDFDPTRDAVVFKWRVGF